MFAIFTVFVMNSFSSHFYEGDHHNYNLMLWESKKKWLGKGHVATQCPRQEGNWYIWKPLWVVHSSVPGKKASLRLPQPKRWAYSETWVLDMDMMSPRRRNQTFTNNKLSKIILEAISKITVTIGSVGSKIEKGWTALKYWAFDLAFKLLQNLLLADNLSFVKVLY